MTGIKAGLPGSGEGRAMSECAVPTGTSTPEPYVLDTRPIFDRGGTPCSAVDAALKELHPGQPLVMIVPFEPVPLYTKLGNLGFEAKPQTLPDGNWQVEFRPTRVVPGAPLEVPPCSCSGAA